MSGMPLFEQFCGKDSHESVSGFKVLQDYGFFSSSWKLVKLWKFLQEFYLYKLCIAHMLHLKPNGIQSLRFQLFVLLLQVCHFLHVPFKSTAFASRKEWRDGFFFIKKKKIFVSLILTRKLGQICDCCHFHKWNIIDIYLKCYIFYFVKFVYVVFYNNQFTYLFSRKLD